MWFRYYFRPHRVEMRVVYFLPKEMGHDTLPGKIAFLPKAVFLDLAVEPACILKTVEHPVGTAFGNGLYAGNDLLAGMFLHVPKNVGQLETSTCASHQVCMIAHEYP